MVHIKRLKALDSLRGLAAFGVALFWHYQHFTPIDTAPFRTVAYWFYHYGISLVDFFFVLSGFIFSYVYKEKILEGKLTLGEYGFLRFSRLYPLHFITLIVVCCIQAIRSIKLDNYFVYPNNDVYHFLLNVFFIQSGWFERGFSFNAPTWSVSCELLAYLIFFLVLHKQKANGRYLVTYIAMVFVGLFIVKTAINIPALNENTSRVFIGFFIGCLTYEANLTTAVKKYAVRIAGVALLVLVVIGVTQGHVAFGNWAIIYTVLIYPLIIFLTVNSRMLTGILSFRPLAYLGAMSYSIYLWHFPIQLLIKTSSDLLNLNLDFTSRKVFIFYAVCVLAMSVVSYETLEKPLLKYLRQRASSPAVKNVSSVPTTNAFSRSNP